MASVLHDIGKDVYKRQVQAEQIFTIDKSRALKYLGHLTPEEMRRVDDAVRISLAPVSYTHLDVYKRQVLKLHFASPPVH